jgi:hypothetical protein
MTELDSAYRKKVWAGDPSTVKVARANYEKDPEGGLLPFATALYSFRMKPECIKELFGLRPKLEERVIRNIQIQPEASTAERFAVEADLLATYLEWMSRQHGLSESDRYHLRELSKEVVWAGLEVVGLYQQSMSECHTRCLLDLTYFSLLLGTSAQAYGKKFLDDAQKYAPNIEERNQRVRVYCKLGMLYRRHSWLLKPKGFYWGIRACFVRGVPNMVRAKSVAALFGIDQ